MKLFRSFRAATITAGIVLAGIGSIADHANATPVLSFSQAGNVNTVTGTQSGSTTTIATTNTAVSIGQIDAALATPLGAFLTFSFASTGAATTFGGSIVQDFSGTFCITSAAGCGGTNYLSGSLVDVAFGTGSAFNINASTPPATNVVFTSSVIPASALGLDRGVGFSFANVTPGLSITNNTIASFTSSVTGTFSAAIITTTVPEPASLALLGAGLVGLGVVRRRRRN